MLRKPCYQQLQWAQNLIDFMEEYGSHFSSGVFSGSLRLPGEEITFQSGGDYSLPFHFTLEHFLKEIDVNFTACHVGKFKGCPPCKSGVEHVIGDHLPDSAVPKSAFNLSAIVTLFNPDAITRLEFSRFSPETFQWQSSVLYLFLRSCLLHYTIVQIEECHGLSGSSEFVFYVELPKNIGWVNKRFTEDGSKFFTNHTKFVKLIFGLDETKGKLFFYSAYPISMDKFQTAVSGGSAAADEEEEY
jgi:hypothetical protein